MLNALRYPFLDESGMGPASDAAAFPVSDLWSQDAHIRTRRGRATSELPLADTDSCLSTLRDRLAGDAYQRMSPRRRMRIARGVTAEAELLLGRVAAELVGADFPIGKGGQGRAESAFELACELGEAFLEVANSAATRRIGVLVLTEVAAEGLSCFSQALLISVLARQNLPQGFWQSVHLLYARALEGDVFGAHGIHSAYVRTLLLALSRSNNLSQRDIVRLYEVLDRWSTTVRLTNKPQRNDAGDGVFAIRLWSDAPPVPVDRARHLIRGTACLGSALWRLVWIDVRPLLNRMETAGCETGLSVEVLHHLRRSWGGVRCSRATRLNLNMDVEIAVGFDGMRGLFEWMSEEDKDLISEQQSPPAAAPSLLGPGLVYPDWRAERNRVLDFALQPVDLALSEAIEVSSEDVSRPTIARKLGVFHSHTLDAGCNGLCLNWPAVSYHRISVGQFIGLKSVSDEKLKAVGLVRWIGPSRTGSGGLSVGVELVGPMDSMPMTVSLSSSLPAFWIPKKDGIAGTVIAPAGRLDVDREIAVGQPGQPSRINLTGIRESTSACTCFDAQVA